MRGVPQNRVRLWVRVCGIGAGDRVRERPGDRLEERLE